MKDEQIEQVLDETIAALGPQLREMVAKGAPQAIPVAQVFAQTVQAREQLKIRALAEGVVTAGIDHLFKA